MDYSLLVAIHNLDLAVKEEAERQRNNSVGDVENGEENGAVAGTSSGAAAGGSSQPPLVRSRSMNPIKARNAKGVFVGIIDILQTYGLKMKAMHFGLALTTDRVWFSKLFSIYLFLLSKFVIIVFF